MQQYNVQQQPVPHCRAAAASLLLSKRAAGAACEQARAAWHAWQASLHEQDNHTTTPTTPTTAHVRGLQFAFEELKLVSRVGGVTRRRLAVLWAASGQGRCLGQLGAGAKRSVLTQSCCTQQIQIAQCRGCGSHSVRRKAGPQHAPKPAKRAHLHCGGGTSLNLDLAVGLVRGNHGRGPAGRRRTHERPCCKGCADAQGPATHVNTCAATTRSPCMHS